MIKNYFTTIWRQLRKKPRFYILNILGLSVGISSFILMYHYSAYELSFDRFHEDADDIYRVNFQYTLDGRSPYVGAAVFAGVAPSMKAEFPQVKEATRIIRIWGGGGVVRSEDQSHNVEYIQYAEPSFFDIFSFPLLEGERSTILSDVHTAVISTSLQSRIFGDESGVGKTIELQTRDGLQNYLITGTFEPKENSHYKSELLLSFTSLEQYLGIDLDSHWQWFDYITYVKLQPGTNPESLEALFPNFIDKYATGRNRSSSTIDFDLQRMSDIHLHSHINQEIMANGDYQTVIFLLIIAFLMLFIAWINYINLYTAKATERGKEVGIRKTLGSTKQHLRMQFILEASMINLMAIVLGLFLVKFSAPLVGNVTEMQLSTDFFGETNFWLGLIGLWLVSSVLSGAYPAFIISNYEPLMAIRSVAMKSSGTVRRGIVVWQFMASAALIVGATTVYHQLSAMNSESIGIDTEDVVVITVPHFTTDHVGYLQSITTLKNEFLGFTGVEDVSYISDIPGKQVGWRGSSSLIGSTDGAGAGGLIYKMVIDPDYMNLYGVDILSGRNFIRPSDTTSIIINEKALELYGFNEPSEAINKRIWLTGVDTMTIIGVVQDYYQESLKEPVKPTAYFQMDEELMYIAVRVNRNQQDEFIRSAEVKFKEAFPGLPFDWQESQERLEARHQSENTFLKAFNLFVILSFFISALGLVGLASFTTKKRQKEMGLRKVLGSSVLNVIILFFKEFVKLALIGNVIALPIIYYFSNQWLNQFSFRTDFLWWLPALSFGTCLLLAFGATIFYILRVAKLNPVKVLNHE